MSDVQGYQGWTNYETWATALWLDNEQHSYEGARETARQCYRDAEATTYGLSRLDVAVHDLADVLREELDEAMPDLEASMWSDLLRSAFGEIDWKELAEHYLDDEIVAECLVEELTV